MKNLTLKLGVLVLVLGSFALGHWVASLRSALSSEADYAWDLHRKIGTANLQCGKFMPANLNGRFYVQSLDDGSTLMVASFDESKAQVQAFVLDVHGRFASDAWPLACR